MRYTFQQFQKEYLNDDVCLDEIFENRYGDVDTCPKCHKETKFYRVNGRKCYACKWCSYQLHPLAETIFAKSETPLTKWFQAIYLFSISKNGVSAKEIERFAGVTYKTAWRMAKQIRTLMDEEGGTPLDGTVEADETYIGGRRHRHEMYLNKTAVIGMVEKKKYYGRVRAIATKQADATVALPFIHAQLRSGSTLQTDESRIYNRVKREYAHEFINHSKREYARGLVSTNTIEGFWSQMKRSLDGTYHAVSPKYLQTYVNEFVFRYNHRLEAVCPVLLERASKHAVSVS